MCGCGVKSLLKFGSYYLDTPYTMGARSIILVPYAQVQKLINEIASTFKVSLSVPKYPFTLTFYEDGTPQPTFLGTSQSRTEAQNLQNSIPPTPEDHGECPPNALPNVRQVFAAFKEKCEDALLANKKKGTVGKKKKEEDRLLTIRDWYGQLRRTQRYLGLRPKSSKIKTPDPSLPWAEQEAFRLQQLKDARIVLQPLDVDKAAPHPFEKEPVIISIDVESYEKAHHIITEIGVSTLDTLDLVNVPPGPNGKNWISQIRSRHFRIKGREHLINRDFCIGNPDHFQFGDSEFIELTHAPAEVDRCFEWPFSVQYKHAGLIDMWSTQPASPVAETGPNGERSLSTDFGGLNTGPTNVEQQEANKAATTNVLRGIGDGEAIQRAVDLAEASQVDPETIQRGPRERNILLLGQDIRSDLDYLKSLGSKIFTPSRATYPIAAMEMMGTGDGPAKALASIVEALDTAPLYRVLKKETQNRSLTSIMSDLGLLCYFPHNGGNDARYTLEALLAMVVKARLEDDETQKEDEDDQKAMASTWDGKDPASNTKVDPSKQGSGEREQRPSTPPQNNENLCQSTQGGGVFATSLPVVNKEDLDDFEAAMFASSGSEASPPRQQDKNIVALAERLRMDATLDEEPRSRLNLGRGGRK